MDESYYNKFVRLHETSDSLEANEYLECGWVLLNVVKTQVSEESWNTYYILGWNKCIEDIKRGRGYKERVKGEFEEKYGKSPESVLATENDDTPF